MRKAVKRGILETAAYSAEHFRELIDHALDLYEDRGGYEMYRYLAELRDRVDRRVSELEADQVALTLNWPLDTEQENTGETGSEHS
jgi:hypothetical protein